MSIGDGEEMDDAGFGETSRYAAHLDRGWSLLDRADFEAARASANHAQRIRPDAPDAAVLLGAIALAEGDAGESLRWYDQAIELDPDYFEPYAAAAQVALFDLGDATRALHYCDDALELDAVSAIDAMDLELLGAECLISLGRDEEARARLDTLREHPLFTAILQPPAAAPEVVSASPDDEPDDVLEPPEVAEPAPRRVRNRSARARDAMPEDEADADAEAEDDEDAVAELSEDEDGEPLDEEERSAQVQRVLQFALRLSRLWLDLGSADGALPLLRAAVERFPGNADAWHLVSEAEFLSGDARAACHAALRVYRLDAQHQAPKWLPTPAQLHRKVVHILSTCTDEALRELGQRRAALVLLVHDVPSLELVLEGVDPRVPAIVLATRGGHHDYEEDDRRPELTGLAVYRRNLMRMARSPEQFDQELRFSVLEELANFFQLSDTRRTALGLPPLSSEPPPEYTLPPEPEPEPVDDDPSGDDRPRRRRRKRMLS
ncbi:MAG: tetratricopeptide repeat protein [Myxococcales bacterium]|nr:tetratricopeptide repeat protein [Myxococcales bacterium]